MTIPVQEVWIQLDVLEQQLIIMCSIVTITMEEAEIFTTKASVIEMMREDPIKSCIVTNNKWLLKQTK